MTWSDTLPPSRAATTKGTAVGAATCRGEARKYPNALARLQHPVWKPRPRLPSSPSCTGDGCRSGDSAWIVPMPPSITPCRSTVWVRCARLKFRYIAICPRAGNHEGQGRRMRNCPTARPGSRPRARQPIRYPASGGIGQTSCLLQTTACTKEPINAPGTRPAFLHKIAVQHPSMRKSRPEYRHSLSIASKMRTRSAREPACILRITCARLTFTVTSLMPNCAAICLLRQP